MIQYKWAAAVAAVLILALSACGVQKDPVQIAAQKLVDIRSLDSTTALRLDVETGGEQQSIAIDMNVYFFAKPVKLMAQVQTQVDGESERETFYARGSQGGYSVYRPAEGDGWQVSQVLAEELSPYAFVENMAECMLGGTDFEPMGTELLAGGRAVRYDGILPGDKLAELFERVKVQDALKALLPGGTWGGAWTETLPTMDTVPVSVWIDAANGYPAKLELEAGAQLALILSDWAEGSGITESPPSITRLTLTLTCTGYDHATNFNVPDGEWAD